MAMTVNLCHKVGEPLSAWSLRESVEQTLCYTSPLTTGIVMSCQEWAMSKKSTKTLELFVTVACLILPWLIDCLLCNYKLLWEESGWPGLHRLSTSGPVRCSWDRDDRNITSERWVRGREILLFQEAASTVFSEKCSHNWGKRDTLPMG